MDRLSRRRAEEAGRALRRVTAERAETAETGRATGRTLRLSSSCLRDDRLCEDRYNKRFTALTDAQRRAILDEIAYTTNQDPGLHQAITFFSSFRDLTASGFWTTKMGIEDLQYQGNVFLDEWNGCPDAALKKLGVRYE